MKIIISFLLMLNYAFANNQIFDDVKTIIAGLESNAIDDENSRGFIGKYQLGCMSLADAGLIDKDKYLSSTYYISTKGFNKKVVWKNGLTMKSFLANNENWLIKGGKDGFMKNESIQDGAIDKLLQINTKRLQAKGINLSNPVAYKAILVAAHFGGVESAVSYVQNNKEYQDAFGTKISKYFKAGAGGTDALAQEAKKYLGGKYVWGGNTPTGFDCSGFTKYVFDKAKIALPRTALAQSHQGEKVEYDKLKKGDLLFFQTDKKRGIPVTHVGIYLEDGKFIHAASKDKGIIITPLEEYKSRFVLAKRLTTPKSLPIVTQELTQLKIKVDDLYQETKPTLDNAKLATTKIEVAFDPLVIQNGYYARQSLTN